MQIVYQGFDGLDVSFQGQLPDEFMDVLEEAQLRSQDERGPALAEFNNVLFHVETTGAKNGYKFRCDTGPTGAKWFFKDTRRKNNDPWNIRVSCHSLALASLGLGKTRTEMYEFLEAVGARLPVNAERISRVDYAIDFFAPEFELNSTAFVMHSRCNIETNENLQTGNGNSGIMNSVTVGKLPGKQASIYNKRREIIESRKYYWWEIWQAGGLPPCIDRKDTIASRVWRVELRSGKDYLRKKWAIRSWEDLFNACGDMFLGITNSIRYCQPADDSNRSRWNNHQIWKATQEALSNDLFEMSSNTEPDLIKRVIRKDHARMMQSQTLGLAANWVAAEGMELGDDEVSPKTVADMVARAIAHEPGKFQAAVKRAQNRYVFF